MMGGLLFTYTLLSNSISMKRIATTVLLSLIVATSSLAQVVTTDPEFPTADGSVTITFDATQGTAGLEDYDGDIYAHTGVITDESTGSSDWQYVVADWGENIPKAKMEPVQGEPNKYTLDITPSIREYYGVPEGETIEQMAFVFRNSDGSLEGKAEGGADIFAEVYQNEYNVKFTQPADSISFLQVSETMTITGVASAESELTLSINGQVEATATNEDTLEYNFQPTSEGKYDLELSGSTSSNQDSQTAELVAYPQQTDTDRPQGLKDGITYVDDNTVRLSLFAPNKEFVYLIGDFTDPEWEVQSQYLMNRDEVNSDSTYYWIEISGLNPGFSIW